MSRRSLVINLKILERNFLFLFKRTIFVFLVSLSVLSGRVLISPEFDIVSTWSLFIIITFVVTMAIET